MSWGEPVSDRDNDRHHAFGAIRDITDTKQQHETFLQQEVQLPLQAVTQLQPEAPEASAGMTGDALH